MEIERADPYRIEVLNGKLGDKERYIESDFRIRSMLCPNGHGLMTMGDGGKCAQRADSPATRCRIRQMEPTHNVSVQLAKRNTITSRMES